jgi:hypothetical protein
MAYNIGPLDNLTVNIKYSFSRLGLGGKKGLCVYRGSRRRYKGYVGGDGFAIYVAWMYRSREGRRIY